MKSLLTIFYLVLTVFLVLPSETWSESVGHGNTEWNYEDGLYGPEYWGELDVHYGACSDGKSQSPINIPSKEAVNSKMANLVPKYFTTQTFNIINNGHTVLVDYEDNGSLLIGERVYHALQFHFHAKSEHTIDGKHSELEIHIVHKPRGGGGNAVIAILVNEGMHNSAFDMLWNNLPKKAGGEKVRALPFNLKNVLPSNLSYYSYLGSLTTPPCTESVRWYVLKDSIEMSKEQIKAFTDLYGNNYRPTQLLNNRALWSVTE